MRAHKKKLESSLVHAEKLKRLVNASQNLTLLMVKQQDFVKFHSHIIADINVLMTQKLLQQHWGITTRSGP